MRFRSLLGGLICLAAVAWVGSAAAQSIHVDGHGVHVDVPTIHVEYYTPQYYLDYPVFYDDYGEPYYYVDGEVYYVPHSYVRYRALRRHYRLHNRHYRRWYREQGHRHHGYVRGGYAPLYHDGYVVYYDANGIPFYYVDDRRVFIPRHHPRFAVYRTHYRQHRRGYRAWHGRHGPAYRRHRVVHRRRAPAAQPAGYGGPGPRPIHAEPAYVGPKRRHRVTHQPAPAPHYGRRTVDCRKNPNHPACRRRYQPAKKRRAAPPAQQYPVRRSHKPHRRRAH